MKMIRVTAITILVLLLAAGTGFAKTKGFYLGGSIGQGTLDLYTGENFTTETAGYKVFGGYRFGLIGIEGGYNDFGKMENGGLVDAKTTGWDAFGVLNVALGPIDLFGKLGAIAWDIQVNDFKKSDTDLAYGLGVAVRFGSFSIRGEYENFDIADTEDVGMVSVGLTYMF